jgi:hypothetical protein
MSIVNAVTATSQGMQRRFDCAEGSDQGFRAIAGDFFFDFLLQIQPH